MPKETRHGHQRLSVFSVVSRSLTRFGRTNRKADQAYAVQGTSYVPGTFPHKSRRAPQPNCVAGLLFIGGSHGNAILEAGLIVKSPVISSAMYNMAMEMINAGLRAN
jgi:hypothetical protein